MKYKMKQSHGHQDNKKYCKHAKSLFRDFVSEWNKQVETYKYVFVTNS